MKESYEFMKILSIGDAQVFAKNKTVVIVTGVTGQDGSFMVDYLLKNTNYEIFGGARRLSVANHENISHLANEPRFHLINFDLTDAHSISQTISQLNPYYFINFAAQSFVKSSWDFPAQTWDTNTKSIVHILEAIRLHCPACRFYNAGSSEEFGNVEYSPQDENHPLRPRSPYGASKASARQLVKVYRDSYSLYAIQGWLFNHEGTRRGEDFVTRKITKGIARIHESIRNGKKFDPIELGNVDAKRDWSDAEDCVDAVWKMLNQDRYNRVLKSFLYDDPQPLHEDEEPTPEEKQRWLSQHIKEYVVASGETHSIREFVEKAFAVIGIKGKWVGKGIDEVYQNENGVLIKVNSIYYRPADVEYLMGNFISIARDLGWTPTTTFDQLVKKMVVNDLK